MINQMRDVFLRSFIKRQTSGTSSDNEWQRMTTSDNEWYNEWQRMTTSDNEWQRVVQQVTTNDSEWYNEWQRVVQRVAKSNSKWQRVTANGNKRHRVRAVVQRMKTVQYTSKNGWLPSFQWQFQFHFQWHYYLKGWMAAIRVVK